MSGIREETGDTDQQEPGQGRGLTFGVLVGAAATIVAALIGLIGTLIASSGNTSPAPSAMPSTATSSPPIIAITSWSEDPAKPRGKRLSFAGTLTGMNSTAFRVHVVAQLKSVETTIPMPSPLHGEKTPSPKVVYQEQWLVSPSANVNDDGSWQIKDWLVVNPPERARWVAVIQLTRAPEPANQIKTLESSGPDANGVVATTSAVPSRRTS